MWGKRRGLSAARSSSFYRPQPAAQSFRSLLDEATAALDAETACRVTDSILNLEGMTRIVVTHRLDPALLGRYDRILVLKDGALDETGNL